MSWFNNDICWCGNSIESNIKDNDEVCTNKNCFRHFSNFEKPSDGPIIYTASMLKGTSFCPNYAEDW